MGILPVSLIGGATIMPRMKSKPASKSALIRLFLSDNPKAGPKEIKEVLAAKGIEVTDSLISQVKYSKKRRGANGRRKAKKALTGTGIASSLMDDLVAAKKLADQMGGVSKAREALDLLARLQ
jgi:hypothetical protein